MAEIRMQGTIKKTPAKKKSEYLFAGIFLPILLIAVFLDLKYKGMFYRYFLPRKVQAFVDQLFEGR